MKGIYLCVVLFFFLSLPALNAQKSTTISSQDVKLHAGLVRPQARSDSLFQNYTTNVCGGTSHGPTHYITSQNVTNIIQWYIHTPSDRSNCMIRFATVSDPTEKDFNVIRPVDVTNFNDDGSFACGRTKGLESRTIRFTGANTCDHCVIEWIWSTPQGKVRECADVMITSGDDAVCPACFNGGFCNKGYCVCPAGYSGATCLTASTGSSGAAAGILVTILLVIIAAILLILILFFCWVVVSKRKERRAEDVEVFQPGNFVNREPVIEEPQEHQARHQPERVVHHRFEDEQAGQNIGNPANRLALEEFKE